MIVIQLSSEVHTDISAEGFARIGTATLVLDTGKENGAIGI